MKLLSRLIASILLILLGPEAARPSETTGSNAPPLNIYVPGSYTGIMPFLADGIFQAARVFADDVNRSGGLMGRKVVVIPQDDKADLTTASANAQIALNDPNHLITLGQSFSSLSLPIGKIYARKGRLFFTAYATSSEISKIGGTVFQLCFNDESQGSALARVALERLRAKRILVMTNRSDPYSDGLSEHFLKSVVKFSRPIETDRYDYIVDRLNYQEMAKKIQAFMPDLIFLPELKVHAADIVRNLASQGITSIQLLGADGWGSEDGTVDIFFPKDAPTNNNSYFYTYHWHPDINSKLNHEIKKRLSSMTGKAPYGPGVLTYEALQYLRTVIQKSHSVDNEVIARLLRGSSFLGSTGEVTFLKNGSTRRKLVLLQLTHSRLKFDSLISP